MIRLTQAVVVEGKYDQIKLASLIDGLIIPTNGFGIFRDKDRLALLRRLAESRGLVIMTDSDAAGFMIRNRLKAAIPKGRLYHAYIPDRPGKEKRKTTPSAEGKLGVEGMDAATLLQALADAGVTAQTGQAPRPPVTKADLYAWGLTGTPNAARRRAALQKALDLPARMNTNTLAQVLGRLYEREQIERMLADLP